MKTKNAPFVRNIAVDSMSHLLDVLCAIGRVTEFRPEFSWDELEGDYDVEPFFNLPQVEGELAFGNDVKVALKCIDIWSDEVSKVEDDLSQATNTKGTELTTVKLAASYIYIKLMGQLSKKQIANVFPTCISVENNEIRYNFETMKKKKYVVFSGDEMDDFLNDVKKVTCNNQVLAQQI
jgi:hypothetical protein